MNRIHLLIVVLLSLVLVLCSAGCETAETQPQRESPTIIEDTTAPGAPSNLTRTAPDIDLTPTFTWSAANDVGTGVAYYLVSIDFGSFQNTGNATGYTVVTPLVEGNHNIQVKAVDNAQNEGAPAVLNFVCVRSDDPPPDDTTPATDTAAPLISGISTVSISTSGATVTWTTDEPATSKVEYGPTAAYGLSSFASHSLTTSHTVNLTGLVDDTVYHFRVMSTDASNNEATSVDRTFRTPGQTDIMGPVISTVWATTITKSGAEIRWTTNEGATSQVEYGPTSSYGSLSAPQYALVSIHSVTLTGLASRTTYHYRVKSKDSAGNEAISLDYSFATDAGDTKAPEITGVEARSVTMESATIVWTTNEGSTSQVSYGTTTACVVSTPLETSLVNSHTVNLSGLTMGTTYYFRVGSTDWSGNQATSDIYTFRTFSCSDFDNWIDIYYCTYGELPVVPEWMEPVIIDYYPGMRVHKGMQVRTASMQFWNGLDTSQREQLLELVGWLGRSEDYQDMIDQLTHNG